jgi:acyl-CoA synthetase (AMP-forming)/AMP-acid ligase II
MVLQTSLRNVVSCRSIHSSIKTAVSDLLAQRAEVHPDRTAYIAVGSDGAKTARLMYGELHRKVESYAAALTTRHIGASRTLMLFEPGLAFVIAFLGCLRPAYAVRRIGPRG